MADLTVSLADSQVRSASVGIGSLPIGTASPERRVVIFYMCDGFQTGGTIGGINYTIHEQIQYNTGSALDAYFFVICSAVVPTGTTATFIPDVVGLGGLYTAGVYAIYGDTSTYDDSDIRAYTAADGDAEISFNINTSLNSVALGHVGRFSPYALTEAWTTLDEDFESATTDLGGGSKVYFTGASRDDLGAVAGQAVTATSTPAPGWENIHHGWVSFKGPDGLFSLECDTGAITADGQDAGTVFLSGDTYRSAKNNFIARLGRDGVSDSLDALYIFAAPTESEALTNLIDPGTYDCTPVNSPSFFSDYGYRGELAGIRYLDTGFNPATAVDPKFTQNSASMTVYVDDSNDSAESIGGGFIVGEGGTTMGVRVSTSSGAGIYRVNSVTASVSGATFTDAKGMWTVMRHESQIQSMSHNGVRFSGSVNSSIPPRNMNLRVLGQSDTSIDDRLVRMAAIGNLTEAQDLLLYNAFEQYLAEYDVASQGEISVEGQDVTLVYDRHAKPLIVESTLTSRYPDSGPGSTNGIITGLPIGTPDYERRVVIFLESQNQPTTATLNGIPMTIHEHVDYQYAFQFWGTTMMSAVVNSGDTGELVVTGQGGNCWVTGCYAVRNGGTTVSSTYSEEGINVDPLDFSINMGNNSAMIAHAGHYHLAGTFFRTWTGLTEDFDHLDNGPENSYTGASLTTVTPYTSSGSVVADEQDDLFQNLHLFTINLTGLQSLAVLSSDQGDYTVSGQDVNFLLDYVLASDTGGITVSGEDVTLFASRGLACGEASYSITGYAVTFDKTNSLRAEVGQFAVSGEVTLTKTGQIDLFPYDEYTDSYDPNELPYKRMTDYAVDVS